MISDALHQATKFYLQVWIRDAVSVCLTLGYFFNLVPSNEAVSDWGRFLIRVGIRVERSHALKT